MTTYNENVEFNGKVSVNTLTVNSLSSTEYGVHNHSEDAEGGQFDHGNLLSVNDVTDVKHITDTQADAFNASQSPTATNYVATLYDVICYGSCNNTESSDSSGDWIDKFSYNFTPKAGGHYLVGWQSAIGHSSAVKSVEVRCFIDTSANVIGQSAVLAPAKIGDPGDYTLISGFSANSFNTAQHNARIQFRNIDSGSGYIRSARVTVRRIHPQ